MPGAIWPATMGAGGARVQPKGGAAEAGRPNRRESRRRAAMSGFSGDPRWGGRATAPWSAPPGAQFPAAGGRSALRRCGPRAQTCTRDERRRGRPAFVLFYAPQRGGGRRAGPELSTQPRLGRPATGARPIGRGAFWRTRSVRRGNPDGRSRSNAWPARAGSDRIAGPRRTPSRSSARENEWS